MEISREALQALYNLYDTWWNKVGTFEHEGPYCLLSLEDDRLMQDAASEIDKHFKEIATLLGE